MTQSADILIVGAGPAGLALALQQARRGRSVLLLERAGLPRDKVCGEGVMPLGLDVLAELGVNAEAIPGSPFDGLDYRTRRQATALRLRPGRTGRGMRRTALLAHLQVQALAQPGVTLQPAHVQGPLWEGRRIVGARSHGVAYRGRVVVAADGVNSPMARGAGVPLRRSGYRMGLRQHFTRPAGPLPRVAVGLFPPHDVYLTPVGGETFLATTMTDRAGYDAIRGDYGAFLKAGEFGDWFAGAAPVSPVLGWSHPLFTPGHYAPGGMLLVGDAGGGIDPCLGMGISLALLSARLADAAIAGVLAQPAAGARHVAEYHAARRALQRHYGGFDRVFRALVASPRGSELLVWGMRHWPQVADTLFEIVAERHAWRTFKWSQLLRPVLRGVGRGGGRLHAPGGAPPVG
jgi:flavin-dependent dehydrogenase